uniref:Chromosome 3 open reading frame 62 n=1 Tax=Anolis carolinensis TaxID=28377 RepID=G1KH97_ANOCA
MTHYHHTMGYFSSGEMSEKLNRCRKELAAAIGRAMEDLSIPPLASPDSAADLSSDLPTTRTPTPPNEEPSSQKGESTPPTVYCPQVSLPVASTSEKENPLFRQNLIPVTVAPNIQSPKREPLSSKENTWLHPQIFIADRQFFLSLEDSERRKQHLRYALSVSGGIHCLLLQCLLPCQNGSSREPWHFLIRMDSCQPPGPPALCPIGLTEVIVVPSPSNPIAVVQHLGTSLFPQLVTGIAEVCSTLAEWEPRVVTVVRHSVALLFTPS